jgi:hypothetical protein
LYIQNNNLFLRFHNIGTLNRKEIITVKAMKGKREDLLDENIYVLQKNIAWLMGVLRVKRSV